MNKYYLILLTCLLSLYVHAQEDHQMIIHRGGSSIVIPTDEIDSISFNAPSVEEMLQNVSENYSVMYNMLKESVQSPLWVYDDFSLKADESNIETLVTQSGQYLKFNGEGSKETCIKNGMLVNNNNYRLYCMRSEPIKYIGMRYSYQNSDYAGEDAKEHIPPCVLLLGQQKDPWGSIIHILFYNNIVYINHRRNGGDFTYDAIILEGTSSFAAKPVGGVYEVSAYLEGDKLYIKKPDGKYLVLQNEYYKEAFPMACWQVFNKPEYLTKGCIHEIFAGNKPGVESAYRAINKIKTLK